jgi:hypothetical protein
MDSDDLMHADRLARLVEAACQDGADIVADNLIEFYADNLVPPRPLFTGRWANHPFWIDLVDYIRVNQFYGRGPALGYLKPLLRAATLMGDRYDETLRIAEDYDLVVRLLHSGKSMRVYPFPLYFYRKHASSISHRLNETVLHAIRAADLQFLNQLCGGDPRVIAAVKARIRSTETALAFEQLLSALKTANWSAAIRIALTRPRAAALLRLPLGARVRRPRVPTRAAGCRRSSVPHRNV